VIYEEERVGEGGDEDKAFNRSRTVNMGVQRWSINGTEKEILTRKFKVNP